MEREHLGSTGEALKEKAEELADRGMAKAKEAVAEVYETARDAADREGLLPGDKPVAEKVDAVVRAVGETVGGIAERNAPGSSSSEAGTGSGSGSRLGLSFGSGFGSGSGSGPGTRTRSGTGSGVGPGTVIDTGSGLDSGMVSDAGPDKSGPGSETSKN